MLDDYSSGGRGHYRGVREQVGRDAAELFNERRGRIGAADAECDRSQLEGRRQDSPWAQDVDGRGQARRGRRPTANPGCGSGGVARAARGDEYKRRELSGGTDGQLSPAGRRPSGQFSPPPGGRRGPFGLSPGCNATQN